MSTENPTFEVKVDPSLHTREPENEVERLNWAVLDTTWNLLREYAVRITLAEIREQYPDLPSDEKLFEEAKQTAEESGDPEVPTSYADLAPVNKLAAAGLAGAFQVLQDDAFRDAAAGLFGQDVGPTLSDGLLEQFQAAFPGLTLPDSGE